MPMPALLKKISRKSLRKRTQSSSSAEPIPQLPDTTFRAQTLPNPSRATIHVVVQDINVNKPTPPTPITPIASNALVPPQDDLSKDLHSAWVSATTAPKVSKADKILLTMENGVAGAMAEQAKGDTIMTTVKTALETVGALEVIESGVNAFMEGMPYSLDEVAKLHPFIGVAVMAFKAVWALEQKRRDNDKKIIALHMEMKDMMAVLTQLKNVKDVEEVAPDGSTIKGRMQEILKATADDIKACANACDTYVKKKLIVKVIKGPLWEGKLAKFAANFTKHRSEFEFALSIHTAVGIDTANKTLGDVEQTTLQMNLKIDMMMKIFQQAVSPEQMQMTRMIEAKGGQGVVNNDKALKELNDFEIKSMGAQVSSSAHGNKTAKPFELEDLKEELHTTVEAALESNMMAFSRKFEVQKRQIIDELSRVIEHEGDRVISAVTAGPHDRIIDPGWRGSVKARHFVMALRDHFQENSHSDDKKHQHAHIEKSDQWALEYINVVRLQPISEAFDDDASGFVTVAEVNAFTTHRPLGWSLPHWVAYWAIGHHQAMAEYVTKILEILAKMFAIVKNVLPANKSAVNMYLEGIYVGVYTLSSSVNGCYVNDALQERFASYVASEEARIRTNLDAVQYDIDDISTILLAKGVLTECYALPLIYLLLERHFEIFRVAQTRRLHNDELWDAVDTLQYVFDSVQTRVAMLQSIFKQQKLDVAATLKSFSFGLYEYQNDLNLLWDAKLVQEAEFPDFPYDDSLEKQDIDVDKILNYTPDQEDLDFDAYKPRAEIQAVDSQVLPDCESVLNLWHGFTYWPKTSQWPSAGMISMHLAPSSVDGQVQYFTASDRANRTDFKIAGQCQVGEEPGTVSVTFKRTFPARFPTQYFAGTWDAATDTLSGTVGLEEDLATHTAVFVFKHMDQQHMCFLPAPVELESNRAQARWRFAIAAVVHDLRRARWSWPFFQERRDNRRRFIELYIRSSAASTRFGTELSLAENQEMLRLKKTFTTADCRFIHSVAEQRLRDTTDHSANCDSCGGGIGGARISCLQCQMVDTFNTVDFCEKPNCMKERCKRDDMQKVHQPHHDLMKVRRVIHTRLFGKTYRDAKAALAHARSLLDAEEAGQVEPEEEVAQPLSAISPASLTISIPKFRPTSMLASPAPAPSGPSCANCSKSISMPCWYCVQCGESTFICWECDMKEEISFGTHDFHGHDLVRVAEVVEEKDLTVEERLGDLEERFAKHEQAVTERLTQLENSVDARLVRVENLLEQLVLKLVT
ncbi:hypothetical protein FB45DRAFT_1079676 [Roridomyces roridus]|uniref:Vacuolar protein sorting-associated protein 13 second N-terminal domain-containing protein n=1 Tax=Roridomyces roridus TaxID=1738132 RepID=A0AAD7FMP4_9AGAR|nr:hypothetical protein FB45DRAFT_1079676 [Roridomyces roridus]